MKQVKAVSREKRAAEAAKGALEVDLKAVLARHAREVEAAAAARREAARGNAARAAAEAEIGHLTNQVSCFPAHCRCDGGQAALCTCAMHACVLQAAAAVPRV